MTQACSKVLAHRRPLLALALVAALLAAAALALSPARAATAASTTWSIGLGLKDADGDGIYQKGDTPRLQVTISASIQPDADDQSNGGVTDATVTGDNLMFHTSTRLTISGGQGIEFQTGTNTQKAVLTGADLNLKDDDGFLCTAGPARASTGSSPAVATCTIDTLIDISIPAELENKTYNITGKVQFTNEDGTGDNVTATWTDDQGPADDGDAGEVNGRDRTADNGEDTLAEGERTNSSARVSFEIGASADIANINLTLAMTCDDDGKKSGNKVCKTRIPVSHETEFNLAIVNERGLGVVRGQIAAIVATLVREGDAGAAAVFSSCPNGTSGRASCSPDTTATGEGAYNTTKATYTIKAPRTPGKATLRIQVLPTAGDPVAPEVRELTFVGPATTISLSEPTGTIINRDTDDTTVDDADSLANRSRGTDSITLTLSATDARGEPAAHPTQDYRYAITSGSGSDGTRISDSKILAEAGQKATSGTNANVVDKGKVLIDVTAPATAPLAAGEYTITVSRTQSLLAKKTFRVVGPAASLALEAEVGDSTSVGTQIPITATVTDADGNPVPDGTEVTFTVSNADGSNDGLIIFSGGSGSNDRTRTDTTEGGNGKVTINGTVVSDSNGLAILIATTRDASGGNISQPNSIPVGDNRATSTPVSDCLSKTDVGDFATWKCPETVNADAVFTVLSARGADALWLRSVGTWIGYATIDGAPISSRFARNFIIRQYDTLFIGG